MRRVYDDGGSSEGARGAEGLAIHRGFDGPDIIAGRGGRWADIIEEAGVYVVIVPVGGGGLIAGVGGRKRCGPEAKIIALRGERRSGRSMKAGR